MMNHPTIIAMSVEAKRADLLREAQQARLHQTARNPEFNAPPNMTAILQVLHGFTPQLPSSDMPTLTGKLPRISTS